MVRQMTRNEFEIKREQAREKLGHVLDDIGSIVWFMYSDDLGISDKKFEQIWDKFGDMVDEEFTENYSLDLDAEDM
jgi:hypothetical protein